MSNRRNFLMQTGMAATALLAAKPFEVFAKTNSSSAISGEGNSIILLHSNSFRHRNKLEIFTSIKEQLKKENANVLLLDAGCNVSPSVYNISNSDTVSSMTDMQYDAILPGNNHFEKNLLMFNKKTKISVVATNVNTSKNNYENEIYSYKIVRKGGLKIGIIGAVSPYKTTGGFVKDDIVSIINTTASFLKENKKCNLVVCLSNLDYKNGHGITDLTLAKETESVDVIIGSSGTNLNIPSVVLNKTNKEVIINHTSDEGMVIGKLK